MKKLSTSLRLLPLFIVPAAFLVLPGCGGGSGLIPTPTPTVSPVDNIALGQRAFALAVDGYDAGGNSAAVRANLQNAVNFFQLAVTASPNSSDANAGLAGALLSQAATDPSSPLVALLGSLLNDSDVLGLDNIVALKGQKSIGEAPISVIKRALPKLRTRSTRASIGGVPISTIQTYIATTELPRMQRIAAALAKTNKTTSYGFAVYKNDTTQKKLYGPDLQVAEAFAKTAVGLLATINGYNLDPGTLYDNVDEFADLDSNNDGKLTPAEYTGSTNFLQLRTDGATNLTLALTSLREAATTADAAIRAEVAFNAPADALIRLTASQKQQLNETLPYVTQIKTALAGEASFPVGDGSLRVNIPEFYVTPLSDLRQGLPTVSFNSSGDVTGYTLASGQNTTFGGVFPDGTIGAINLLDDLFNN
ncbi:hypothetical protein EON83_02490 [bacterium]|nr:MAG: hypothetical protein EON83_02490 [bacterium]